MSETKHLICFLGRNGSGKTFSANKLVGDGYTKISMADAMRELLWGILGHNPNEFNYKYDYNNFKENNICMYYPDDASIDENGFLTLIDELHLGNGRQLLQNIGESCKQMFGEDFWVNQWEKRVNSSLKDYQIIEDDKGCVLGLAYPNAKITTDDIRFPIEIESAHKLGAIFVWCDYKNGNYNQDEHPSEALANKILANGRYKHGDEIPFDELKTFFK